MNSSNPSNLILIGMPGAGKSTVGVVLAKRLGYRFIDSDLLIQEREGKTLSRIIEQEGTEGFLAIEEKVNCEIMTDRCVIATGGSAVYSRDAMRHLKSIGVVVYLWESCSHLKKRLGDLTDRGVVLRDGQTLEDLYAERAPLYEKYADLTVREESFDISGTVREICAQLKRCGVL
ncbi:MAG: shikimate kinase [Lachnospiraceae bacterium]|jgi:shikimate kinase|nr:shikimate kinase [Lachnospiraceae bacterium]MCI1328204.1 shikimate kinase [Lachnospiraceae bacterium]